MSYSKRQKAEFFRQVNNVVDDIKNTLAMYPDMTVDETFDEFDYPVSYSMAKWAIKTIEGDFPSEERVKRCGVSEKAVRAENQRFIDEMNYKFGEGGW